MDRNRHIKPRKSLMGFDFDGTLVSIVSHPDKVKLNPAIPKLLKQLKKKYRSEVLILSGRSLKVLKSFFPGCPFYFAGNHGFECQGPGLKYVHPKAKKEAERLQKIKKWIAPFLKKYKGTWVEDKKYTFSVHFRALPAKEHASFCRALRARLRAFPGGLKKMKLRPGKCVLEIRPQIKWDKGELYLWLQKKLKMKPGRDFFSYVGDDVTDEDVFKVMPRLKGVSVYVGSPHHPTRARFRINSQKELLGFLKLLAN